MIKEQTELKTILLENGLKVELIKIKNSPLVTINTAYRVGSKDEDFNNTGFAHLFEHLMFEGTKNLAKGDFDKYCALAGGNNNAFTIYDYTDYYITLPAPQLELGLFLESDRMANFEITQEMLDNQKSVVCEEIKQTVENQPYASWREYLAKTAYSPDSSYSWEVHGSADHVANAKLEDAKKFHSKYYSPNNAAITICGGIDLDDSERLIREYFSLIQKPKLEIVRNKFDGNHLIKGKRASFYDNAPHSAVFLSFHIPSMLDDKMFSAEILANILGEGRSSRLYKKLCREKQIASTVGAFADKREKSSLLTIYTVAQNSDTRSEELESALVEEILNISKNGAEEIELEKARNQFRSHLIFDLQKTSGAAEIINSHSLFGFSPEFVFDLPNKYAEIQNDDIINFALEFLKIEDSVVVSVEPEKERTNSKI